MKKKIALLMAMIMLFAVTTAGTLAWLQAETTSVVNTFTYGTIDITLQETPTNLDDDSDPNTNDYQMIPGSKITKDPFVKVLEGSEDSWVFVKIEKSANFDDFMTFELDENWSAVSDEDNVYYYESIVTEAPSANLPVLKNNTVTVKDTVTKAMMDAIKTDPTKAPTLTFTAYAVQAENFETAQAAWDATFGA